jgi:hypothetical protein
VTDLVKTVSINSIGNSVYTVGVHDPVGADGGTNSWFYIGSDPSSAFTDAEKDTAVQAFADSLASGEGRSIVFIKKTYGVEETL